MSEMRQTLSNPKRSKTLVLLVVLSAHVGILMLFLQTSIHAVQSAIKPPVQLPVPLPMVMVKLMAPPGSQMEAPSMKPMHPVSSPAHAVEIPKQTPVSAATPITSQIKPAVIPQKNVPAAPAMSQATTRSETAITSPAVAPGSTNHERASSVQEIASSQKATVQESASPKETAAVGPSTPPKFGAAYLNNPAPKYPPIAKRLKEEGRAMLRVLVSADGAAKDVKLHSTSGSSTLDDAAIKAVRQWRFVPAKQGSTAVEAWVQVPIEFKLD